MLTILVIKAQLDSIALCRLWCLSVLQMLIQQKIEYHQENGKNSTNKTSNVSDTERWKHSSLYIMSVVHFRMVWEYEGSDMELWSILNLLIFDHLLLISICSIFHISNWTWCATCCNVSYNADLYLNIKQNENVMYIFNCADLSECSLLMMDSVHCGWWGCLQL